MRVLTVVEDLGFGGTQRNAQNFAIAYREQGHESAALGFLRGGPRAEELRAVGVDVFGGGDESREAALSAAAAWGADIVHIHRPGMAWPASALALKALRFTGPTRPKVIETSVFARVDYSPSRELIDVHAQISRWCLWKWRKWARGLRPAPIGVLVPYIVDGRGFHEPSREEAAAFRREHNIPPDALVFGRVGSPIFGKWSPLIFHAFEGFARTRRDAWLVVVGLPPELEGVRAGLPEPVRRRIVSVPVQHGDAKLRRCYGAMDVFLHASMIGESFGMVLCEAMLCGVPVVTRSSPVRDNSQVEVVGHERGGLIVNDAASMIEGMRRLADAPELRKRLARQGADWALARYGPRRVGSLLDRLIGIVRSAGDRRNLAARLAADEELTPEVTDKEISALMRGSIGRPSLRDRVLLPLISTPTIHRTWSRVKRTAIKLRAG